ncbi:LOW QUALITY PROTEIN: disks large-associated protein 5-like [Petaurus breviceps papuanus]|uniref:LOW QUALITY PROTEIN: disks large-associated protein 5-like n=1 Tax=Petaurus breviceps papuanus TaxID=3040969 RepID=UPI0036DAA76A
MPKLVLENQPERKAPTEERPSAKIELKADKAKVLPSKVGRKEDLSKDPLTEETSHNSEKSAAEEIAAFLGKEHLFETSFASRVREKPSFAPENFVFQPLDSLMNYRMKPISPQKEHTYVKPSCFWSPLQIKADNSQELKRETLKESKTHCNTPVQQDLIDLQTPPRFQEILDKAKDLIRTTIGQIRLLISERFKQFEGLVNDCEYKSDQKKITCMDLDGFGDMVNFQVEHVNKKFEKLSKLQESEWQEKKYHNPKSYLAKKKAVPAEKCKSKQDDAARTSARSRLAALKASMREKLKQEDPPLEIVAPMVPKAKEIDKIVFDAELSHSQPSVCLKRLYIANQKIQLNTKHLGIRNEIFLKETGPIYVPTLLLYH